MSTTATTRREILDGIKNAIWTAFNATSGTTRKLFRDSYRGPAHPVVTGRPVLGVSDGGQRRGEDSGRTGASNERVITVLVTCHLKDNWTKIDPAHDWTEYIEEIIKAIDGNLGVGAGLLEVNYIDDDPVDIVWADSSCEAAWIITFEIIRFVDY